VVQREIARLKATCENPDRLAALEAHYRYLGEQTCAADGLCATSCPVEINTGAHTKQLRGIFADVPYRQKMADWATGHHHLISAFMRTGLKAANGVHQLLGTQCMQQLANTARKLSGNRLPAWNPYMPKGISAPRFEHRLFNRHQKVVYFPSCINTAMGPALKDPDQTPLYQVIGRVLERAGFGVILPPRSKVFCCGTPFESKGYVRQADQMAKDLENILMAASENGRYPVLCDTGPCVYRMRQVMDKRLKIFEPVEFIQDYLLENLEFQPTAETVAVHITCSSRKMGLEPAFREVAGALAPQAIFPEEIWCCGWAGDRGFNFPELTASALAPLRASLQGRCTAGYSNSRTCEIGLSQHSGIYYKSFFYLLERCSI
jgi:D-lactate dehydrogenase